MLSEGRTGGGRPGEQVEDRECPRSRQRNPLRHGFDQHGHGGQRRSSHHLRHNMSGGTECAVGMRGESRVTVGGLDGASEEDQEDAQNAEQQPHSAASTALRQRFGANFHHSSVNIPQVSTVELRSRRRGGQAQKTSQHSVECDLGPQCARGVCGKESR